MSYWSRSFPGLPEYLGEVRRFVQMVLGDVPGAELVVLAVSELAGNAVLHTASGASGGQFVVHLAAFADRWQVRVDDEGSPTEPRVLVDPISEDTEWDAESGRGLAMVASISRKWGVLGDRCARAVWAEIPYPVAAGGVESVMSGGMLEALESVARALDEESGEGDEDDAAYQGVDVPDMAVCDSVPVIPSVSEVPAVPAVSATPAASAMSAAPSARWPGTVRCDPARAERFRAQASQAAFLRALVENAYAETLGPRPLPYWPPFPIPLAPQGASRGSDVR